MKTKLFLLLFLPVFLIPNLLFAQYTQQGPKLIGSGGAGYGSQGRSAAISSDGNTAVIGGYYDNNFAGAVWVFTRSGGVWTQQGPKLAGSGAIGNAYQGVSVAISSDGNTIIVGGSADSAYRGAVWIFTRSGGVWTQQGPKLIGSGMAGINGAALGWSVALSSDGNTAIAGGYGDNNYVGATWVFTRSGGVWTQQGAKLVGTGGIATPYIQQGWSVAVSGDGNTLIECGSWDDSIKGAFWIFTRSGNVWTQQGGKFTAAGEVGQGEFGFSTAISSDGNTAVVGGDGDNGYTGAMWVYTRNGSSWTQQGAKLVGSGYISASTQGTSVALSSDGNVLIEGGCGDNNNAGAIWVFTRTGGAWTQLGSKLFGSGTVGNSGQQGISVASSSDGSTFIEGGYTDNVSVGASWVFYNPTIGIIPISSEIPKSFSLSQNYPNPFNPTSNIKFDVQKTSFTVMKVYDIIGREVATLVNQQLQPGTYEVSFDGTNLPSGIYFYRLESGSFVETKKMSLVK